MAVKPIPDGYHNVTPYLIVNAGQRALDYYKQAFGASELFRMDAPGGTIGHAEIQIGNSRVMLSDENPAWGAKAPTPGVSPPVQLMIYVEDVDATFKRALAAGAKETQPIKIPSFRSSHPAHENARTHAQCANRSDWRWTSLSHHTVQRLRTRSRLNFLRAHRIR